MVGLVKVIYGWVLTSNRWALCFAALAVMGVCVGTRAEVPKWMAKAVIVVGGQSLRGAVESLHALCNKT